MPVDDHGHEEAHLPKDRAEPLVLPDKKQWQVTRSLSSYQYALPPLLVPVDTTSPPPVPSANSMVYPLSHFISYSKFSKFSPMVILHHLFLSWVHPILGRSFPFHL